jgi:hypothetical protein
MLSKMLDKYLTLTYNQISIKVKKGFLTENRLISDMPSETAFIGSNSINKLKERKLLW